MWVLPVVTDCFVVPPRNDTMSCGNGLLRRLPATRNDQKLLSLAAVCKTVKHSVQSAKRQPK